MEEVRHETRGALAHQFKYIEEASNQNELHLTRNKKLVEGIQLQVQFLTEAKGISSPGESSPSQPSQSVLSHPANLPSNKKARSFASGVGSLNLH